MTHESKAAMHQARLRPHDLRHAVVRLGELLPYIGIVVVTAAFFLVIGLGRLDLSLRGLYLAIPIIIASIWLIRRKNLSEVAVEEDAPSVALSSSRFTQLTLLNALIFIVSIIMLLASETRPLGYFILMAAFAGIVFVQILGMTNHSSWQKGIILGELILLALNFIWSITLKYPLYFGGTDILPHLYFIDSILQSSHVTNAMGSYQYFPLYHIFLASGVEVLGLGLRDAFFILVALAYMPAILFAYLIFKSITGNERLSLIACLLFSVSGEFIFYGGYMVARALAFVLFMIIFYLLFRQPRSKGIIAILALSTVTIILTHQVTLIFLSVILALFVGFQWLLARPQANPGSRIKFTWIYLAIFVPAFVSYWFIGAGGFGQRLISSLEMFESTYIPPTNIPPTNIPPGGVTPLQLVVPYLVTIKDHIAEMLFLFFAWLGFAYLLRRATNKKYITCAAIGLLGLTCLVVYLPNPIHLLPQFNSIFQASRMVLLLTAFMSLAMAYGIVVLARSFKKNNGTLLRKTMILTITVLVVAFSFFSIACVKNASDAPSFRNPYFGERRYFTVAELSAFSFVQQHIPSETPIYSDNFAMRYFVGRPADAITQADISYIKEGCLLLRTGELEDRWLAFCAGTYGFMGIPYKYNLETAEPNNNILNYLSSEERIYDNTGNQIYMMSGI